MQKTVDEESDDDGEEEDNEDRDHKVSAPDKIIRFSRTKRVFTREVPLCFLTLFEFCLILLLSSCLIIEPAIFVNFIFPLFFSVLSFIIYQLYSVFYRFGCMEFLREDACWSNFHILQVSGQQAASDSNGGSINIKTPADLYKLVQSPPY